MVPPQKTRTHILVATAVAAVLAVLVWTLFIKTRRDGGKEGGPEAASRADGGESLNASAPLVEDAALEVPERTQLVSEEVPAEPPTSKPAPQVASPKDEYRAKRMEQLERLHSSFVEAQKGDDGG